MESDTPRTDAEDWITQVASVNLTGQDCVEEERVVDAAFARKLERELDAAIKERNKLRDDRTALIAECDCLRSERQMYWRIKNKLIAELAAANAQLVAKADELAAMRKERDEARRWLCEVLSNPDKATGLAMPFNGTARCFAEENGWDCFAEGGGA